MEWRSAPRPHSGPRVLSGFLWRPKTIRGITRWFMRAKWRQIVRRDSNDSNGNAVWCWIDDSWIDED